MVGFPFLEITNFPIICYNIHRSIFKKTKSIECKKKFLTWVVFESTENMADVSVGRRYCLTFGGHYLTEKNKINK